MVDIPPHVMAEIRARLDEDHPHTDDGWTHDGSMSRPIWSPWGFLRRGDRYCLRCRDCGHTAPAPLAQLVARGFGDRPMHRFRWRCACGSTDIAATLPDRPG